MRIELCQNEDPEISLIALIDCIFFLLMFFMVATSFKQVTDSNKIKALPIVLPKSAVSLRESQAAASSLALGMDKGGNFYWENEKVTVQEFHNRLKKEAVVHPGRPIRIDGDESTAYKNIVHLVDLCQFEGFTNITLHTRD
jgi:biopolymer transport protein ExbD